VRKIVDEQQTEGGRLRLSTHGIYETIRRSNSSLNRKPKKLLEDSIERVLEVFQSDILGDEESDSVNGDFDGLEEEKQAVVVRLSHSPGKKESVKFLRTVNLKY
jgi:ribosome biogenesis ATPase